MSRRTTVLASLATAAVTAVAVGGLTAPADAAKKTSLKNRIASIAAQVVDQKAATLSVQHAQDANWATTSQWSDGAEWAKRAATARDAETLGGKPASAYGSQAYRVSLPPQSPMAATQKWTFPSVPAGTYTIDYDVTASVTGATTAFRCGVFQNAAFNGQPSSVAASSIVNGTASAVGSGVVTLGGSTVPSLSCTAQGASGPAGFQLRPEQAGSSVVLTRVDELVAAQAAQETTPIG
jgi:hypothetical protein